MDTFQLCDPSGIIAKRQFPAKDKASILTIVSIHFFDLDGRPSGWRELAGPGTPQALLKWDRRQF